MKNMIEEFKKFITRGNVVDLAVAVIIGIAFGAVVLSFTNDILMAIIGAVIGQPSFDQLDFTLGDSTIRYGLFVNAVVNFLIISFALFLIIKVVEKAQNLRQKGEVEDESPAPTDEALLLGEIRDLLAAQQSPRQPVRPDRT